ncbi:MAG: SMC-Scp complex subunit ScpB [Proteobacteria bacterium]|nr:SMC-Scp complex subunit ScpB [Pseudomonadota bacterium]
METVSLARIIEAALLAAQRPLSLALLAELFADEPSIDADALAQALASLQADCAGRGVELVEVASGWRYQVRTDVQPWVSRLWAERQAKYTRATLETLALIAYRQPITRGEIEAVRGVAVNTNTIKTLEEREWIRVVGHRDVPGKPALYGTTRGFLDYFGLKSLDQLPPLAEIGEIAAPDPELPFESVPTVAIIEMELPDETGAIEHDAAFDPLPNATEIETSPEDSPSPVAVTDCDVTTPARHDAHEPSHD